MAFYESISDLVVDIESIDVKTNTLRVSEEFLRKTSTVTVTGKGETGMGEDVIYEPSFHQYPDSLRKVLPGTRAFDEVSDLLGRTDLFEPNLDPDAKVPGYRSWDVKRRFRRWTLESAILDLALKQNGTTLAQVLSRRYEPVRFAVSPSKDEQTFGKLEELIDQVPGIEFKLNAMASWDRESAETIASLDRTRVVDFKSHYEDLGVDPDYELYEMVATAFDDVILEDPKLTDETRSAFSGHEDRLAWDKSITGIDSIEALPVDPEQLNIKPSRFGTVESLLNTIEYCENNGIDLYGGGMFELDVGRRHIQALASLFYPDAPNDVAPSDYNGVGTPDDPLRSPLEPNSSVRGLHWRAA